MTTTTHYTIDDQSRLMDMINEFSESGRTEDAALLARLCADVIAAISVDWEVDDPQALEADFEEADRQYAAGGGISHEEMLRRLERADG